MKFVVVFCRLSLFFHTSLSKKSYQFIESIAFKVIMKSEMMLALSRNDGLSSVLPRVFRDASVLEMPRESRVDA